MANPEREKSSGESLRDKMEKAETLVELKDICTSEEYIGEMIPEDVELMKNPPEGALKDMDKETIEEYFDKFQSEELKDAMHRIMNKDLENWPRTRENK